MAADENGKKSEGGAAQPKASTPAERALAEAEARRKAAPPPSSGAPREIGRDGPEPTRYGDWEKGGIASDF
jgi:hypothetical protein